MPKYRIELQDGRKFDVEADRPPTEADVMAQIGGAQTAAPNPPAAPVDYAKLARQHGGTAVDYAALAREAGGTASTATSGRTLGEAEYTGKPLAVGGFEDSVVRFAADRKLDPAKLSAGQIRAAKAQYESAGRAPAEGPTGGDPLIPEDPRAMLVRKMVAEGTSDDDIRATLKVFDTQQQAPTPAAPPQRSWTDTVADALPAVGGFIGGQYGRVPGVRMLTAGIGGAAGEGYRQLVKHGAELPGAVADVARNLVSEPSATLQGFKEGATEGTKNAAIQGGIQVVSQGVGEGLVAGVSKAAPILMNRALNLTDRLAREFPNLSTTMIDHAIDVTGGGLQKARGILRAAKAKASTALQTAHATGATVPITAATDGLQKTLTKVINSEDIEGGLKVLAAIERKAVAGRAAALTPMAADALKTSLQTQSKALYVAQKMGQGRPNVSVQAQALQDMAESLNDSIGQITTKAGAAGYRAANAGAEEMIGAVRGITKGIRPGSNLYQAMVRPGVGAVLGGVTGAEAGGTKGALVGGLVGGALTSPAGMSRLAVTLGRPSVQAILRQSPRLATAMAQLMGAENQEQP